MSDSSAFRGNIEAAFARMEGKIDRLVDKMDRAAEETVRLRDKLHEHGNELAGLTLLNIPEKIASANSRLDKLEARVAVLEADREQRKGAMAVVKVAWGLVGAAISGGVFVIIKIAGVM